MHTRTHDDVTLQTKERNDMSSRHHRHKTGSATQCLYIMIDQSHILTSLVIKIGHLVNQTLHWWTYSILMSW